MNINKKFFHDNGYLIVKNFYDKKTIYQIKKDIYEISWEIYKKFNQSFKPKKFWADNFDEIVLRAKKENIKEVTSAVYDSCKKITGFYKLMGDRKLHNIAEELMGSKRIGILPKGFGMRIDYPNDEYYKARLHQDYTSQLGSPNGIVFYTSLGNVTKKNGAVVLYTKSHTKGIFKTKIDLASVHNKKTYDPYTIQISKNELQKYKIKHLVLKETDLALFHFMLLHKSGTNTSNKIRWSIVHRMFDFSHKQAISQNYIGGQNEGNIFNKNKHLKYS
jgi:ectoine hydroxylase-related dioxygenase (phytanoyl-CoA dioxygenase family)